MNHKDLTIKRKFSKKLTGEDAYRIFSIRIRINIFNQIEEIISETGHSRNELVNILIVYALDHFHGVQVDPSDDP